jgi:endonuclease/exonuclease/phosphatase family metal-dependent hydrolase
MVGDFNATWGNRGFRAILDTGMTDAAAARGQAFDMTWSQNFFVLPPIVRFDHVLTNSSLAVTTITTLDGPGSDHRALEATVAVLPAAYPTSARQAAHLAAPVAPSP